jgi:NDP-sugar pyrophosphorylase family protein
MKAMVLAAGEGTRLRPFTLQVPKAMLAVSGRPTLEWILLWLRFYGITEIVVNLHHRPQTVLDYFGDGSRWGVRLTYSLEPVLLGTAAGLKRMERCFTEPFVVVYGDVLTDMDLGQFLRFHRSRDDQPHATLSVYRAPNPQECGVVEVTSLDRVTRFVEKPPADQIFSEFANMGVLIFDPPLLACVPSAGFFDLSRDLLPLLLRQGVPVYAQLVDESVYVIDIGTPEKYERVQHEWPTPPATRYLRNQD